MQRKILAVAVVAALVLLIYFGVSQPLTIGPVDGNAVLTASVSGVTTPMATVYGGARLRNYNNECPPDASIEIESYIWMTDIGSSTIRINDIKYTISKNGNPVSTTDWLTCETDFTSANNGIPTWLAPRTMDITSLVFTDGDTITVQCQARITMYYYDTTSTKYYTSPVVLGTHIMYIVDSAAPIEQSSTIQFKVRDDTDYGNLAGARVTISGSTYYTDSLGELSVGGLAVGTHAWTIVAEGYATLEGQTTITSIGEVKPQTVLLEYNGEPMPDEDTAWLTTALIIAAAGILVAILLFAFAPFPPNIKAFLSSLIVIAALVAAHLKNIGVW